MKFLNKLKFPTIFFICGISFFDIGIKTKIYAYQAGPVSVAVTKVTDRSGAPWWKERFEEKFKTILSTELSSAGHFLVIERDSEALADIRNESLISGDGGEDPYIQMAKPKYIIRAYLSDYEDNYVSFDLKVINTKTSAIAYSRSIEGTIWNEIKAENTSINTNNFKYREQQVTIKKTVPTRAIRSAITEIAEYLDCVLYLKDECIGEYEAKEERRKRSNDALEMF